MLCPKCGLNLDSNNYCNNCLEYFNPDEEEVDYDSMVNNGSAICLNCTYWSVSPYGKAHGMYCRRGNGQTEPNDTCFDFVQSHNFASYGSDGQYQFDETSREISNKLNYWKSSR